MGSSGKTLPRGVLTRDCVGFCGCASFEAAWTGLTGLTGLLTGWLTGLL